MNNSCNNNCIICNSVCESKCPICLHKGIKVPLVTVKNLVKDDKMLFNSEQTYICSNKKCDIIYYQYDNPNIFYKKDVKTKVWFKEKYNDYIVCYCHNIYLKDIVSIVKTDKSDKILTKEDILSRFEKKHEDCLMLNPVGNSCDKLFLNAIEYAYKQKKED